VERPFVGKEPQRTVIIPQITSQDIQRTLAHRDASDTMPSEGYKSVKSVVTVKSSLSKGDPMAELEAELEAELDQLTGGDSVVLKQQISVLDDVRCYPCTPGAFASRSQNSFWSCFIKNSNRVQYLPSCTFLDAEKKLRE
jgi:hypothetical protein